MHKRIAILIAGFLTAGMPLVASAHAHASYLIGSTQYDIVIGSLGEPVVVDDKTGVDLRISSGGRMVVADDGDMEAVGGAPAAGLEDDLKVEVIAGSAKKIFDLTPVYNAPGSYKAVFFPTVATTLSYRIFGTLEGTPVDLTFTCLPEGGEATAEGEKQISDGVKQLMRGGAFGCPLEKSELGFPEAAPTLHSLESSRGSSATFAIAIAALVLAVIAFARKRI